MQALSPPSDFMNRLSVRMCALVCWAALAAVPLAARQPETSRDLAAGPETGSVREALPELFYLEDDGGRLVPVPGFRYRDFMELFRLKEGLAGPAQPPAAVIERVVCRIDGRGEASAGAGWSATIECSIRQWRSGWVAVPVGLRGFLLEASPVHEGPGRMVVDPDPAGGMRCWFEVPADAGGDVWHTVRFTGRVPVEASPTQESLAIDVPTAVASRLEVLTARPAPAVSLAPAAAGQLEVIPDEDGGLVVVTGIAGELRLRITDAASEVGPAVLAQVESESVVRVSGRTATIETKLMIAGLPPGASRLKLSLPKGMTLRGVGGDATRIAPSNAADRPWLDIAVSAAADGRGVITLECEGPVDPSGESPLEPLGFAVEGIEPWRQWGRVSLIVDGDLQANWDDVGGLRRVDPPAAQREPGFVAAFAYDAQPATLAVRIRPRRSRVVIEPEYRYDVSAGRIRLDGRLRVAARGAAVNGIAVALDSSWSLEDVGPPGLVDAAALRVEAGLVTIPFLQPLAGDAVVEFAAARSLAPDVDAVAWEFPTPRADLVGPAAVVISADANIELAPDTEASQGLVRQTASAIPLADAGRIALVYRLDTAEGRFAATRRFLPRRVEASVAARVTIDDQLAAVEETIRLYVMHLPLEFVELTVPEAAIASGTFEIRQGPELLDPVELNRVADADAGESPRIFLRALLPVPLVGEGEVVVRYTLPIPDLPREATVAFDLPLALPVAAGPGRETVVLADAGGLTVGVRGDAWRRDVTSRGGGIRSWSAPKPQPFLPLSLTERVREAVSGTVVEAAWLQTRLFPQAREDIATLLVTGASGPFAVQLPLPEILPESCDVRVDGRLIPTDWQGRGRMVIDLDDDRDDATVSLRLVEIRTTSPWGGTAAGFGLPWPLPLDPPGLPESVPQRRFSWEVITAPDDHLLGAPARWTSQQRWSWRGIGWQEEPVVSQAELADWIRSGLAAPEHNLPLLAADRRSAIRRSVYSGVGPPGRATIWVVPTWMLVLLSSGPVLAGGLASLTRPSWRRPFVLVILGAVGLLAAAAAPGLAPLIGQAAVPGLVLVLAAAGLHAALNRQPSGRPSPPPAAGAPSSLTRTAAPTVSLLVSSSVAGKGRDEQ